MTRTLKCAALIVASAHALVLGQGGDAAKVLADARAAMGGDKLAAVKTMSGTGRILRTSPDGNTRENEFELALELPDKYLMRSVIAAMGSMSIYRNSGFNGGQVLEEIDRPPNLQTGNVVMAVRVGGPLGGVQDPATMTPEQKAEISKSQLLQNRKEYARLALGMFAASPAFYPLTFTHAGQAESPDGKADVIDVKGEGDFSVRLFVDSQTHLPLMLSWMDKEPLSMTMTSGPGGPGAAVPSGGATGTFTTTIGGGGGAVVHQQVGGGGGGGGQQMTPEQREKMMADFEARRKEAEAKRRTVEYRVYYADYQAVNGAMLPHKIQRSIDGKPVEEMVFDKIKVNPKIDAKTFQPINK